MGEGNSPGEGIITVNGDPRGEITNIGTDNEIKYTIRNVDGTMIREGIASNLDDVGNNVKAAIQPRANYHDLLQDRQEIGHQDEAWAMAMEKKGRGLIAEGDLSGGFALADVLRDAGYMDQAGRLRGVGNSMASDINRELMDKQKRRSEVQGAVDNYKNLLQDRQNQEQLDRGESTVNKGGLLKNPFSRGGSRGGRGGRNMWGRYWELKHIAGFLIVEIIAIFFIPNPIIGLLIAGV